MRRSDILLWTIVILVVAAALWLVMTGRVQTVASLLVNGYLKFMSGFLRPFHR